MKIAVYVRVSTTDQNPELQTRELSQFLAAKTAQAEFFEDVGHSGASTSRPALNRLLDAVRKRKFDAVLVWRFDRFARSTQFLVNTLTEFHELGVQFISYQENLDTSTPMGKAMFSIIAAMAQLERDVIRERVVAGLAAAKARGVHLGPKFTVPVDKVRKLRAEGLTHRAIAKQLGISRGSVFNALKRMT